MAASVSYNPLILLVRRFCVGVAASVALVTHNTLKSLSVGSAPVLRWCVPHTPHTLCAPLGWCASVMKEASRQHIRASARPDFRYRPERTRYYPRR